MEFNYYMSLNVFESNKVFAAINRQNAFVFHVNSYKKAQVFMKIEMFIILNTYPLSELIHFLVFINDHCIMLITSLLVYSYELFCGEWGPQ